VLQVLTIVLSILVVLLIALCLVLLTVTRSLRAQLGSASKQLDRLERALQKQERQIARLDAQMAARPHGLAGSVAPLVEAAAGYRDRGIVPTILIVGWRLVSGYLRRKDSARSLAKR
jgi:hypothetical protein